MGLWASEGREHSDSPGLSSGIRPRVAVVLAAGRSERLRGLTGGGSKALLRLGGLALIERTILSLLKSGFDRVVVVTGYQAGPVAGVARGIDPGRIRAVYAEGWEAGNGASLAAAEEALGDEEMFLLLTADHVFRNGALAEFIRGREPASLVDPAPDLRAWAEGTKVAVRGGQAVAFGKHLNEPAIDCGVFLLTRDVFVVQREAAADGDHTLAGALTRLVQMQPLRAVPIPRGSWWLDIDTPEDLRRARTGLRRSLIKDTDGPVSRFLNRLVSTRISMAIAPLRPPPSVLSAVAFLLAVVAGWFLGAGEALPGALLAQAASIADGVDGELARLQVRAGPGGALLDGVLDRIADATVLGGLAVWALSEGPWSAEAVIGLTVAATTGSMLSMASKDRVAALALPPAPEQAIGYLLGGRDGRLLLVAVFALFHRPLDALLAVAVSSSLSLILRLLSVARQARLL